MKKKQMTLVRPFVSPRTARKLMRQRKHALIKSKKGQDSIQYLPSEIMLNILSRLPILSIMRCKCVCKSWLDLIKSDEFLNSHLSKSVPGLAVYGVEYRRDNEFVVLVDGVDLNCRWKIDLNERLHSCANGLLFLHKTRSRFQPDRSTNIICNPVTREYMLLPPPPRSPSTMVLEIYGFGVSRMSGIYKVVAILIGQTFFRCIECRVYSVGLGCIWRSIESPGFRQCHNSALAAFLKGNLHCLGYDPKDSLQRIYCIDLETETFTTLSPPPTHLSFEGGVYEIISRLSILGDCLCACCNSFIDYEIHMWLMKEYGDEKSWTKQFVIYKASFDEPIAPSPIKVFENGDILMENCWGRKLIYYSSKTATIREAQDVFGLGSNVNYNSARIYTPTFLSLKTLSRKIFADDVFSF